MQGKKIRKKVSWEFFFLMWIVDLEKTVRETKLMFSFIGEMNDLIFHTRKNKSYIFSTGKENINLFLRQSFSHFHINKKISGDFFSFVKPGEKRVFSWRNLSVSLILTIRGWSEFYCKIDFSPVFMIWSNKKSENKWNFFPRKLFNLMCEIEQWNKFHCETR